jgi:hypothetical protein
MIIKIKNTRYNKNQRSDRTSFDRPIVISNSDLDNIYYEGNAGFVSYVGLSVIAYSATWDLTAGSQVLNKYWWNHYTDTPIQSAISDIDGVSRLLITPNISSYLIGYVEIAKRDGITEYSYSNQSITIQPPPIAPIFNGVTSLISGSSYHAGATLVKPVYNWWSPVGIDTTTGEWIKNGIPTGVSTSTYSDTANKDIISWNETATDLLGRSTSYNPDSYYNYRYVNDNTYKLLSGMRSNVTSRISSLSGGSTYMNVFSAKNQITGFYIRNPKLWCSDLVNQLTSCVAFKKDPNGYVYGLYESYGGILITPRHVLYCNHAHPWTGAILTFVASNGQVINTSQIDQARVANDDLHVGLLDTDVNSFGIPIIPISPLNDLQINTLLTIGLTSIPYIGMSQGSGRTTENPPPTPMSNYPQYNDIMCYIKDGSNGYSVLNGPYERFNYALWDGDSGTQGFLLYNNVFYLQQINTHTPFGGVFPSSYIDGINAAILQSDLNAVAAGKMLTTTGYSVSASTIEGMF